MYSVTWYTKALFTVKISYFLQYACKYVRLRQKEKYGLRCADFDKAPKYSA